MTTQNTLTATICIPLGVLDACARVHEDGTVTLSSSTGQVLPSALTTAAWSVLGTWMLQPHEDGRMGEAVIPVHAWRELFSHRLQPA